MTLRSTILAVSALLLLSGSDAFAPAGVSSSPRVESALQASPKDSGISTGNKLAAGVLGAALFVNAAFSVSPAVAFGIDDGDVGGIASSSQVISARSGGRVGGRSSMGGRSAYRAPPAPRTTYRSSTTVVRPMISAPPVVVSPFGAGIGYGYGYNPMGGFGLGYGLGAMNSAGTF